MDKVRVAHGLGGGGMFWSAIANRRSICQGDAISNASLAFLSLDHNSVIEGVKGAIGILLAPAVLREVSTPKVK